MSKIVVENTEILKKKNLGNGAYSIKLAPFSKFKSVRPGQFVHLLIPNCRTYFRRAFSVYDLDEKEKSLEILFKVFGRGTAILAEKKKGDLLNILGPLGNGFEKPKKSDSLILIAGGVGMPPIYLLAKRAIERGQDSQKIFFFYGGRTKTDLVDLARIKRLGINLISVTEDGSAGHKGLVTEAVIKSLNDIEGRKVIYSCGPEGMLKAVDNLATKYNIPGQLSLEAPMPCGVGICLGCIMPLKAGGYTRVCKDGPVYKVGEVVL